MPSARTPRRNGPYAPLSAFYADDDAVIALEDAGDDLSELLFLRSLAHCAREPKLNGFISLIKVRSGRIIRRPTTKLLKAAGRLVDVGLWIPDDSNGGGWKIRQWTKWNASHEEIIDRMIKDAARKAGGNGSDSARNDDLVLAESELQGTSLHDTSFQSKAKHGSSNAGSGSVPPPRSLPPDVQELAGQLAANGVTVAWELDPEDLDVIQQAISRCGSHRLLKQAKSRYRPDKPAFSARAFIAGWATMPAAKLPEKSPSEPCTHGESDSRKCALCRRDQLVAV